MGMTLSDTLTRVESLLEALTYTGGASVFKSVEVTSEQDVANLTADRPAGFLRVESMEPYGSHGDTLMIAQISLDILADSTSEHGRGHVQDKHRVSNAQQGASLTSILAKVVPALWFKDTDASSNHSTWLRLVPGGGIGRLPQQQQTGRATLSIEALCTLT